MTLLKNTPLNRRLDNWRFRITFWASVEAERTNNWNFYFNVCDSLKKLEMKLHGRD